MANRIKGLTIEIGGDTTALSNALKGVNKEISTTQQRLKDVEKLLKLDPNNTELLAQKQKLLGEAVKETSNKLNQLRDAEAQVVKAFEAGQATQEQVDALRREIIATEQALRSAEEAAASFNPALARIGNTADAVADKARKVADATRGISTAAAAGLAGIAALGTKAVQEYADYEQLIGGVETLFKDNTGLITKQAEEAFRTVGVDANTYMETVTGFSASLIASLGGDTKAAAEVAGTAMQDMADNANKMGTSMDSISNAYQGFAKQNYTMLDNLKLGYGGTKTEMERLLKDAEKFSGVKYDISSYSDVVKAIHVIQKEMDITGTTAKEAATTITGSLNATKASLSNLVAGFATEGADVEQLMQNVIDNLKNVASNLAPVLETLWANIPKAGKLAIGMLAITAAISPLASLIANVGSAVSTCTALIATLQPILGALFTSIQTFVAANPVLAIIAAIIALAALINAKADEIREIITQVDEFLQEIFLTDFTEIFGPILGGIINAFVDKFQLAWEIIKQVLGGVIDFIQAVFAGEWQSAWNAVKGIFTGIFDALKTYATNKLQSILDFLNTIIEKVKDAVDKVKELGNTASNSVGSRKGSGNTYKTWDAITNATLPLMANGGVISGNGSAIVGEAGAELLTLANGRATVTPININMSNTFGDYNAANGKAVARDLVRQINLELGRAY